LTILPLGDSLTWGYSPDEPATGGYRSRLYTDFVDGGQHIQFEGSVYDRDSRLLEAAGEAWHEGHGGYWIHQITENLEGVGSDTNTPGNDGGHWLDGTASHPAIFPNVILLMAGTNDINSNHEGSAPAAMTALLGALTTDRPNSVVFVSTVIPLADPTKNVKVQAFNNELRTVIVPEFQAQGAHVVLVDQYSNFINANGSVEASDLLDGVHPDRAGYDRMGDTWYAAIEQYENEQTARPL